MPIQIDATAAGAVLEEAIARARSSATLAGDWTDWTTRVGDAQSKTYVAALGTALLARTTDARADPMSIKASPNAAYAYSARTLCHNVLVPASREHGFDLGATGREPLNNQPFFRYERIDEMDRVRDNAGLKVLLGALEEVGRLNAAGAAAALASFVRVRLEVAAAKQRVDIRGLDLGVADAIHEITDFISENPEGGKRGQALVAAAFDLAFAEVRMGRVNDPSRRFPGDVQVLNGPQIVLAAEVRQKLVQLADVVAFARGLSEAGVGNGVVVALHPDQQSLDRDEILNVCEEQHGVLMSFIDTTAELISDALLWSGERVDVVLEALPDAMYGRLDEIEVAASTLEKWEAIMRRAARE